MKSLGCDSFNAEYGTSVQQWNAAESGISFVQQTKLVFIFSPKDGVSVKAKEKESKRHFEIKLLWQEIFLCWEMNQSSPSNLHSVSTERVTGWPSAPIVFVNESFFGPFRTTSESNKQKWCHLLKDNDEPRPIQYILNQIQCHAIKRKESKQHNTFQGTENYGLPVQEDSPWKIFQKSVTAK